MATKKTKSEAQAGQVNIQAPHARSTPIGDYGFLSDGEVLALVSPGGAVEWMCVPRFDSPSVFGSILGRHAGSFKIAPDDVTVPADVRYLPGTMILETSWGTPTGLDHRPRRSADRSVAPRGRPVQDLPAHTQRLRGRTHPAADDPLRVGRGADARRLRAGPRLRPGPGVLGLHRGELPPRRGHQSRQRGQAHLDQRPATGLRGRPSRRADVAQGGRRPLRRPVLGWGGAAAPRTRRRTASRSGPPTTGSTGWPAASSPITRGGAICSAAR